MRHRSPSINPIAAFVPHNKKLPSDKASQHQPYLIKNMSAGVDSSKIAASPQAILQVHAT